MRDSFETKAPWSREPTESRDDNDNEEEEEEEDGRVNAAIEAISVSTKKEEQELARVRPSKTKFERRFRDDEEQALCELLIYISMAVLHKIYFIYILFSLIRKFNFNFSFFFFGGRKVVTSSTRYVVV